MSPHQPVAAAPGWSAGPVAAAMGDPAFPAYAPPARRHPLVRYRWYAPLLVLAVAVTFIVFTVTGPSTNRTLTLLLADGTEHRVCATRTEVGPADGEGPVEPGALEVAPRWFVAEPPVQRDLELRMGADDRVTFFDERGEVLASFGVGQGRVPNGSTVSVDAPWAGMLVEVPSSSSSPYERIEEDDGC